MSIDPKDNVRLINGVLKKIPNKYAAVIVASKRSRELNQGIKPLIKIDALKPSTVALAELAEGLIVAGPPKPKRITAQKEEKEALPSPEFMIERMVRLDKSSMFKDNEDDISKEDE